VLTATYKIKTAEPSVKTIAEARAATGSVTTKGVVTYIDGKSVYMQDATAGIVVRLTANAPADMVGKELTATGTTATFNGLLQLNATSYTEGSAATLPAPVAITVADLADGTGVEAREAMRVKLTGVCISVIDDNNGQWANPNVTIKDSSADTKSVQIYKSAVLPSGANVGCTVDVIAVVDQYHATDPSGGYRLRVASTGDYTNIQVPSKVATPTASPSDGSEVVSGAAVTLSTITTDAKIYYTTDGSSPAAGAGGTTNEYADPFVITGDVGAAKTIKAIAVKTGMENSETMTATYTFKKAPDPVQDDPIPDDDPIFTSTVKNVKEVVETVSGGSTAGFTVVGQLVYRFGNYDGVSSAILQDVVGGTIYSLQIYDTLSSMNVGDIVKVTSSKAEKYGTVPQLSGTITAEKVTTITAPLMEPDTYDSFAAMDVSKADKVSRFVKITGVTLGTYNTKDTTGVESTTMTDKSGNTYPIYRAAVYPAGVKAGEEVNLYAVLSRYNDTWQLRTGKAETNSFLAYQVTNDTAAPVITLPDAWMKAEVGKAYTVSVGIADNVGVAETKLTYQVNAAAAKTVDLVKNAGTGKYECAIPGTELTAGGVIKLTITARDAKGNTANSAEQTITIEDIPQVVSVTPTPGSYTDTVKKPEISVTFDNAGVDPTIKLTLTKGGSAVVTGQTMTVTGTKAAYTPVTDLEDGAYTAEVVITRADKVSYTHTWSFTVGATVRKLYFGQLHSHTAEYSDGAGTLADGLAYIKNTAKNNNVQFVAFTDHSNYFDSSSAANPEAALYDASKSGATWIQYKDTIAAFNEANEANGILALGGFEMTWSGGPGHINTFNTDGIVSRNNKTLNNKTNDAGLKAYYALLSQEEGKTSISQFNHPGKTFGTFIDFAYWDAAVDTRITLLEVGNGEGQIGADGYYPSYTEYTKALDKGWHVAPTNNQDNHHGKWGDANDARSVILADEFTEEGLYAAMKLRRVYATEDKNLSIDYTLNGNVLGSIIDKTDTVKIRAVINDPDTNVLGDRISKVEVIANSGRVAYVWNNVNSHSFSQEIELPADYSYYFLRVTQADTNIAVTAPVWVGKGTVVGINSFTSDTAVPVTGEEITFATALFNNEDTPATIKTITYSIEGGEVLKTITLNQTLASIGTYKHEFKYTPGKAVDQTVVVTVVILSNGKESEYVAQLALEVLDPANMVYVGIDASHFNEYVDGNYKDSMSNFTNLAAGYNVRVVLLKTSAELIAATKNSKYKMLVLTPPTRRNGTVLLEGYKNYTQSEVDAVAAFAQAGGTVIVTGWSDYYESYKTFPADDHMAAQQNRMLAAMGSSLRISDDGTLDNEHNAGGSEANKARLYLSNYNFDNPLTKGIVFDKDHIFDGQGNTYSQVFSHYGGTSIYAVDIGGSPTNALPSSISPIVSGFDTTYSLDQDKDGLGGDIPKYSAKQGDNTVSALLIAATETLTGGGKVIVSGGAFMSNFEIQAELDNNDSLTYSNYNILENIIADLNQPEITKISAVHAAPEGQRFTIEGTVTSNASGYDRSTAFFDCIYLQDDTGGINVFPVAGNYQVGQKLRISGTTSSYQGERQLAVKRVKVLDKTPAEVTPTSVSTRDIAQNKSLGMLVKIEGVVVSYAEAEGAIQTITVRDASGYDARVFIDGYITPNQDASLRTNLKVGNKITATGLASYDNTFDGPAPRIRVRNRDDVVCKNEQSTIPVGKSSAVIAIPPKGFAASMEGAEDDAFMREGVAITDPNAEGAVTVTGTLVYKRGFVGFWEDNPEMQEGNYLALRLTLPGYAGEAMVLKFGEKTLTYVNRDGITPGGNPYFDFIKRIDKTSPDFTIAVDLDGEGADYVLTTYTFDLAGLTLGTYVPTPSTGSSSNLVVRPDDVKLGEKTVEVKLPAAGAKLNAAASEKVVAANAGKPVVITGGGLNIIIPAGTLTAGTDVNALLVNPKATGSVIRVTKSDGTTAILPIATVSGGKAAYVANILGKYEVADNTKTFPDTGDHWALPAIGFVSARELFRGDSTGAFRADQPMTRGMLATVLARIDGGKTGAGASFADVPAGSWYAGEIAWAAQNKLVEGDGKNFNPDADLTREQLCVILIRYLNYSGLTLGETAAMGDFSDLSMVSPWAKDAVEQAVKAGLINGKTGGRLDPQGKATRAEIATILQRFVEGVLK